MLSSVLCSIRCARALIRTCVQASESKLRTEEQARRTAEIDAQAAEEARRDLETLVSDLKRLVFKGTGGVDEGVAGGTGGGGARFNGDSTGNTLGENGDDVTHTEVDSTGLNSSGNGASDGVGISSSLSASLSFDTAVQRRLSGNAASNTGPRTGAVNAVQHAARRFLSLSEELRAAKLDASGLRRQVAGLREDRRHLERKLAGAEASARVLEEAKADIETRMLFAENVRGGSSGGVALKGSIDLGDGSGDGVVRSLGGRSQGRDGDGDGDGSNKGGGAGGGGSGGGVSGLSKEDQRLLEAAAKPAEVDVGGLDPEEALKRLRDAHAKVRAVVGVADGIKTAFCRARSRRRTDKAGDVQSALQK